MRLSIIALSFVLAASASCVACSSKPTEKPRTGTLLVRVGDQKGLETLVAAFTKGLTADATLGPKFASVDKAALQTNMVAWLCKSAQGTCAYEGTVLDALGVALSEDEFTSAMEIFVNAMNEVALPSKEQNDLIDVMMKGFETASAAKAS